MQSLEPEPTAAYIHLSHSEPQRRLLGKYAPEHLRLTHRLYDFADDRHAPAVARLSDCCRTPALYQDMDSGEFIVSQKTCKHRLCPKCSATKSARLADDARQIVEKMDSPKFITLTILSTDAPLEERLKHLRDSFSRLRRSTLWKRHFSKGISVVEVTHNPKTDQWHPHLHMIVQGDYCPAHLLKAAWQKASVDSFIVDIQAVPSRSSAIKYIAKYAAKTGDFSKVPEWKINEYLDGIAGLRTHALFGPGARKCIKPEAEKATRRLSPVTQLKALHDEQRHNPTDVTPLLALIYRIARGRVPNVAIGSDGKPQTAHDQIAVLLRAVGITCPRDSCCRITNLASHPPPERGDDRRAVRLWEESVDETSAITH